MTASQTAYQRRCEWGEHGVELLAPDVDAIVIAVLIAQREAAVDAGFSVSRPRGFDIDHREGQQCAQTAAINRFGSDLREKILIGEGRGAAHQ